MLLLYYIDKKHNNYIYNERVIFDNDNKKMTLNNENWYFMVLSDDTHRADSSTAASLTALQNLKNQLKDYIKENCLTADSSLLFDKLQSVNASILEKIENLNTSVIISRLDTLDTSVLNNSTILNRIKNIDASINDKIIVTNTSVSKLEDLLGIANTKDNVINSYKEVEQFFKDISDSSTLLSMYLTLEENLRNEIPTKTSQLTNDSSYANIGYVDNVSTKLYDVSVFVDILDNKIKNLPEPEEFDTTRIDTSIDILNTSVGILNTSVSLIEQFISTFDEDAYYDSKYIPNKLETINDVEVGDIITEEYFKSSNGQAKFGYPENTNDWTSTPIQISKIRADFGVNINAASCTYRLLYNELYPLLKTKMGNEQTAINISEDGYERLSADIKGFYYWGWCTSNNKNDIVLTYNKEKLFDVTATINIEIDNISSYVYIALPVNIILIDFSVQSPFCQSEYFSVANVSKVANNIKINALSNICNYNIWCCGKSTNNADGSVTPNGQSIKIKTQLS